MKFSFFIVTDGNQWDRIEDIINSIIIAVPVDKYEIIIVGGTPQKEDSDWIKWIPWDEEKRPGDICNKKNCGIARARYDNVVISHDYIRYSINWYENIRKFGDDWDVYLNRIINLDGSRFRDLVVWDDIRNPPGWIQYEKWCANGLYTPGKPFLPSYEYSKYNKIYISGAWWVAKRDFMLDNPLRSDLRHGDAEDIEWSRRVRDKWNFKFDKNNHVSLIKYKSVEFPELNIL